MSRSIKLRLAMHPSTGGEIVGLTQVLELVEVEGIEWRLTVFEGIATADSQLDVLDLEQRVRAAKGGIALTSRIFRELAASLDQVIECELRGRLVDDPAGADRGPAVVLSAFDSTEWVVEVDRAQVRIREESPLWPR